MEEIMKKILGEMYKENMTEAELTEALKKINVTNSENTVPLEKYTNLEKALKDLKKETAEKAKQDQAKLDQAKTLEDRIKDLELKNQELVIQGNKSKIKSILSNSGLNSDDMDTILENINIQDVEGATNFANSLSELLKSSIEAGVKAKISEGLKGNGSLPEGGAKAPTVTREAFDKMTYTEQMKVKADNPQLFNQFFYGDNNAQ